MDLSGSTKCSFQNEWAFDYKQGISDSFSFPNSLSTTLDARLLVLAETSPNTPVPGFSLFGKDGHLATSF
jgi:hypothetical protein